MEFILKRETGFERAQLNRVIATRVSTFYHTNATMEYETFQQFHQTLFDQNATYVSNFISTQLHIIAIHRFSSHLLCTLVSNFNCIRLNNASINYLRP